MAVRYFDQGAGFLPRERMKTRRWVLETVAAEGFGVGEVSFIFCSQEYHLHTNRQYLGHDYETDVITFDYSDLAGKKIVSGDIFIDPVTVREQASRWGATPEEEMMRVMIHGVLHLCGHGDKTPAEEKKMRALEERCLAEWLREHGKFPAV